MRSILRVALTVLLALVFLAASAVTQESPAKKKTDGAQPDAKTPPAERTKARAEFDGVYATWKELLSNLAELQVKYQSASEQDKPAIEKEYERAAARGTELAERLKAATAAAFEADPADREVSQLLMAMTIGALHEDNFTEAERLAKIGLAHQPNNVQLIMIAVNAAMAQHKFEEVVALVEKAPAGKQLPRRPRMLAAAAPEYVDFWRREQEIRAAEAKADDLPRVKLQTTKGDIVVELFENEAPNTVANFISLVEKKFYDGVLFHRVIGVTRDDDGGIAPSFMAQSGDPTGTGKGGPRYRFADELDPKTARMHFRGSLSMANSGPNTNGSQFFLTFGPTPHLNGKHTVFGRVLEGLDVLAKINRVEPDAKTGEPPAGADKIVKATVLRKRDHEYKPETLKE
jgi:cyclophilin family peptidyl-prolyl cis-trans isomerase